MLKELHDVTKRIEKLSKAEHDLIQEVHPKVEQIKESVKDVSEKVSEQKRLSDSRMRIEPLGDSALLVRLVDEFDPDKSLDVVLRATEALNTAALPGVVELAPAYTTIGVFFDPARTEIDVLRTAIEEALREIGAGSLQCRNRIGC